LKVSLAQARQTKGIYMEGILKGPPLSHQTGGMGGAGERVETAGQSKKKAAFFDTDKLGGNDV